MKYLVLDIGGSAIKYALMNRESEFLEKGKVKTPKDSLETFVEVIGEIYDIYKDQIEGIAISMPGRIDSDRGYTFTGGALTYNDKRDMVDILKKRCPTSITIENDGKCAALAEASLGNLSDCNDGIVVILGTGIGGGIIKDKKLHKGADFIAGEFSVIMTSSNTKKNPMESMWARTCGVNALINEVASVKNISEEEINGEKVFEYANSGDKEVLEILDEYCYKIVVQLFNLQYIYNPEKIAIGGGISAQNILIEYIQKNIHELASMIPVDFPAPTVVACKFRNDSNLIGALQNFISKSNV
jgi:predicted NBD/HSP70 family sugar kinase